MSDKTKLIALPNDIQTLLGMLKHFLENILDPVREIKEPHPCVIPTVQRFLQKARHGYRSFDENGFTVRRALLTVQPQSMETEVAFQSALEDYTTSLTLLNTSRLQRVTINMRRTERLLEFIAALSKTVDSQP